MSAPKLILKSKTGFPYTGRIQLAVVDGLLCLQVEMEVVEFHGCVTHVARWINARISDLSEIIESQP